MQNDRLEHTNYYLKQKIIEHLPKQSRIATAIPGLMLSRCDNDTPPENCFYNPMIAVVVQGFKRSMIGNEEFYYGKNHCMVVSIDLPGIYHISDATPEIPFLSISIKLDKYIISQLLTEMDLKSQTITHEPSSSVVVSNISNQMLDAFLRLLELLDHPDSISTLAPMIIKELHYYVLSSPLLGESLRLVNSSGNKVNQISRAISWLREHYTQPLNIDDLAKLVNMSSSTFHRHFRQVTTFSPLQFQKQLRLYEAERLMLLEGKDVKTVAFQVGYESPSQFSREYKRQFGYTPHQDIQRKRG